uniref:Amino_oxidase domain-containing protein n=1 Tax=Syphacia muris TaxID=451379 RepID=A0A0N5AEC3_9BILA
MSILIWCTSIIISVLAVITAVLVKVFYGYKQRYEKYKDIFDNVNCSGSSNEAPLSEEEQRKILRQGFDSSLANTKWNAIIIGSGISGLTTAKLLSLAGKKVLVLEQHSKAGGACHTFKLQGVRFDVGLHYVSAMHPGSDLYNICSAVSNSQVQWNELMDPMDTVIVGEKYYRRNKGGSKLFSKQLCQMFPEEEENINSYFRYLKECLKGVGWLFRAKFVPVWVIRLLLKSGLFRKFSKVFDYTNRTLLEVMNEFKLSPELQTVISYYFVNYGSPPKYCSFLQHSLFLLPDEYYPIGGANRITSSIIRSIQDLGSKVAVKADVKEIRFENGKVNGVVVESGNSQVFLSTEMVVSTVPLTNLFKNLIPTEISNKSMVYEAVKNLNRLEPFQMGTFQIYIGLHGSQKELSLPSNNYFWFKNTDLNEIEHFLSLSFDQVVEEYGDPPFFYVSFPSAKDPLWDENNSEISTCQVISVANPKWFPFEAPTNASKKEIRNKRKNDSLYLERKHIYGDYLYNCVKSHFNLVSDLSVAFIEYSTPATQQFYLQNRYGELYSMSQQAARFSAEIWPELRCKSDIPGLYLSGQDILFCGVGSAFKNGLLTASVILETDLQRILNNAVKKQTTSK